MLNTPNCAEGLASLETCYYYKPIFSGEELHCYHLTKTIEYKMEELNKNLFSGLCA